MSPVDITSSQNVMSLTRDAKKELLQTMNMMMETNVGIIDDAVTELLLPHYNEWSPYEEVKFILAKDQGPDLCTLTLNISPGEILESDANGKKIGEAYNSLKGENYCIIIENIEQNKNSIKKAIKSINEEAYKQIQEAVIINVELSPKYSPKI